MLCGAALLGVLFTLVLSGFCGLSVCAALFAHKTPNSSAAATLTRIFHIEGLALSAVSSLSYLLADSGFKNIESSIAGFTITCVIRIFITAPFSVRFIRNGNFNPSTSR